MESNYLERPAYSLSVAELGELIISKINQVLNDRGVALPSDGEIDDELLSIASLARHLGVTKQTIHNHREKGMLPPPCYIGTRPRWSKLEVNEFLKNRNSSKRKCQ